jgi:hypothetical protein
MHFKNGLAYIEIPFSDDEFRDLPHIFTSEVTYDPTSILRLTMNGTTPSLLFNHSLPKVNTMNVAILKHSQAT